MYKANIQQFFSEYQLPSTKTPPMEKQILIPQFLLYVIIIQAHNTQDFKFLRLSCLSKLSRDPTEAIIQFKTWEQNAKSSPLFHLLLFDKFSAIYSWYSLIEKDES